MAIRGKIGRWAVILAVTTAVCAYYLWEARTSGAKFDWGYDLGGYYDYLGRGFASGHLYVPIEPKPELLALPNPWDPSVDDSLKMQDMALYRSRYYLYHGPGPAALLFAPWRLATGHDLPENFALWVLLGGGFLFSCATLLRILTLAGVELSPLLLALLSLALGVCQGAPYLLSRVWVYEIAIGGGYFCLSGAWFFLARGINSTRSWFWHSAAGLMFGLAIACRPPLGLAGLIAAAMLMIYSRRSLGAFLTPLIAVGLLVTAYNFARFGSPFEFGISYLLGGANQNRIRLASANVLPGLYFLLFCPPDFSCVFPWIKTAFRYPFGSHAFPPRYVIETMVGGLYLAPLAAGVILWPVSRGVKSDGVRWILGALAISSGAILLFLAATGWSTQRYETDFLPMAILAAAGNFGIRINRLSGFGRATLIAVVSLCVVFGALVSMALGITGPYDDFLKNRPASYVRIARWFSPVEAFRPIRNPDIAVNFTAEFKTQPDHFREPLLTIGGAHHREFLYVEHLGSGLRVVSEADGSTMSADLTSAHGSFEIQYKPETETLIVTVDREALLRHSVGTLVAAPSQVTIGENLIAENTARRFTGTIYRVLKKVSQPQIRR